MEIKIGILTFKLDSKLINNEWKILFKCNEDFYDDLETSVEDTLYPGDIELLANSMLSFVNNQFGLKEKR
jgi:hypothetical protein